MEGDFLKVFKRLDNNFYPISYNSTPSDTPSDTPIIRPPFNQPIITDDPNYLQGHLNSLIGNYVKVEFIIGTNLFIDKEGILKEVGIDFIVLEEPATGNDVIADLYSIKFVEVTNSSETVVFNPNYRKNYRR